MNYLPAEGDREYGRDDALNAAVLEQEGNGPIDLRRQGL